MLSKPFSITNGTRQGCPLSPIIFNLIMEPLAEHIRQSCNITGFKIGDIEHKINLFADDVILMITNPRSSLASVQMLLNKFSAVSYYKVNEHKSFILGLGLDAVASNILMSEYPYPWADHGIKYLGITLTKSTKGLFTHNYVEARQMLITETSKISKFELTWSGRLAAFKMIALPKLLYIFRTLPIPLPTTYLNSLQSILNQFIWQGKKARCSHSKLIKHRSKGGMGHIDIKDYYLASIISQLKDWFQPTPTTLWSAIENNETPGPNLTDWLFSTPVNNHSLLQYSPPIQATIKAWRILHHTRWSRLPTKPLLIPINTLKHLTPDLLFPQWLSDKIKYTQDLRNITSTKSYPQVQKEYSAPTKDFLTYYRLKKCLTTYPSLEGALPIKLWEFFFSDNTKPKGVSLIYLLLQEKNTFFKSKPLLDWETDLNLQFTDYQWLTAINSVYKATSCTSLWEVTQKTLMRWYLTPHRLAKFNIHASHDCWRGCGQTGTLLHILWTCPHLQQLWLGVQNMLREVLHLPITLTPQLAILNLNIDELPTHLRQVTVHILLATKLLLTRNWKSNIIPPIAEVVKVVQTHYTYETLLSRGSQHHSKTLDLWNPWYKWHASNNNR